MKLLKAVVAILEEEKVSFKTKNILRRRTFHKDKRTIQQEGCVCTNINLK